MSDKARHEFLYKVFAPMLRPAFRLMFNYRHPIVKDVEGPYIVLANHNMELDPLLLACAFPKHMYFVASEHILRKGIGSKLVMFIAKPIIRMKGKVEVKTVAEILRTVRGGTNVCIFAEGARSFNGQTRTILPSTGKLVKRSGASLITYRLEGGYFTQPRWSTTLRKGKIQGIVAGVYTPDMLKAMSEEEVNAIIDKDLWEDAYVTQAENPIPFKGKHLALGMESTLYMCPSCKQVGTLHSTDTSISCSCGLSYAYTPYGELVDSNQNKMTITQWDLWQQKELTALFEDRQKTLSAEPFFSDEVTLFDINHEHQIEKETKGTLTAYLDRIDVCGHTFYYEEMLGLDIFSRNFMVMNYGQDAHHYEMKGDLMLNALKYMYLYQLAKGENI